MFSPNKTYSTCNTIPSQSTIYCFVSLQNSISVHNWFFCEKRLGTNAKLRNPETMGNAFAGSKIINEVYCEKMTVGFTCVTTRWEPMQRRSKDPGPNPLFFSLYPTLLVENGPFVTLIAAFGNNRVFSLSLLLLDEIFWACWTLAAPHGCLDFLCLLKFWRRADFSSSSQINVFLNI